MRTYNTARRVLQEAVAVVTICVFWVAAVGVGSLAIQATGTAGGARAVVAFALPVAFAACAIVSVLVYVRARDAADVAIGAIGRHGSGE